VCCLLVCCLLLRSACQRLASDPRTGCERRLAASARLDARTATADGEERMDVLIADVIGDVALVLVFSSLLGAAARWCGQPKVVGQIIAGIVLGPSLLGRLPGDLTARLFPSAALPALGVLAQVAIVIFMFVVGYELDRRALRRGRLAAALVAAAALVVPMALGSGLALTLRPGWAALGQPHLSRSLVLFMGVALSVTALPVLAAISRERGIAGSLAGVTATAAASILDVAAWLVLAAALIGTAHAPGRPWPVTLVLAGAFTAAMLLVVRPALRWRAGRSGAVLSNQLPVALALALGSAWVTASLGLHPVFGGFLAGVTMASADGTPDPEVLRPMEEVGGLLLPLFFVVTGLSLNIGALGGMAFAVLAILCALAAAGKLGPAYLAARVAGLKASDAATVAALINARGLTELIVLNVGLSAGIIDRRLFTVLVLMALIMTIATVPLLSLISARAGSTGTVRRARPGEQVGGRRHRFAAGGPPMRAGASPGQPHCHPARPCARH
jgi:Kef-type K+ transport system membrane component KefB